MTTAYLYPTAVIFDPANWSPNTAAAFITKVSSDDEQTAAGSGDVLFDFNASALVNDYGLPTINSIVGEIKWCKPYAQYGYAYAAWQKDGVDIQVDVDPVYGGLSDHAYGADPAEVTPMWWVKVPRLWTSSAFPGSWTPNQITGRVNAKLGNQSVYLLIEYVRLVVDYTAATAPAAAVPILSTSTSVASVESVQAGNPVTFTTTIRNTGTAAATNIVLAASSPANSSARTWAVAGGSPASGSDALSSTIASLAAGASAVVTYTCTASAAGSLSFQITHDCTELALGTVTAQTVTVTSGVAPGASGDVMISSALASAQSLLQDGATAVSVWTILNSDVAALTAASVNVPLPVQVASRTWTVLSPSNGTHSNGSSGYGPLTGTVTVPGGGMIKIQFTDVLNPSTTQRLYTLSASLTLPSGLTNLTPFTNPQTLTIPVDVPLVRNPPPLVPGTASLAVGYEPVIGTAAPGERMEFIWRVKNPGTSAVTKDVSLPQPLSTMDMKWSLVGSVGLQSTAVDEPSYGVGPIADSVTIPANGYAFYRVSVRTHNAISIGSLVTFNMAIGGATYTCTGEVVTDLFKGSRDEVIWKQTMDAFMGLGDVDGGLPGNQRMQDHFNKGIRLHHLIQDLVERKGYPQVNSPSGRRMFVDDSSITEVEIKSPTSGDLGARPPAPSAPDGGDTTPGGRQPAPSAPGG